jgi:hypothetical protein
MDPNSAEVIPESRLEVAASCRVKRLAPSAQISCTIYGAVIPVDDDDDDDDDDEEPAAEMCDALALSCTVPSSLSLCSALQL